MLLNNGRHPTTNVTIVPEDVLALVSRGRTVTHGESEYPEVVRVVVPQVNHLSSSTSK